MTSLPTRCRCSVHFWRRATDLSNPRSLPPSSLPSLPPPLRQSSPLPYPPLPAPSPYPPPSPPPPPPTPLADESSRGPRP